MDSRQKIFAFHLLNDFSGSPKVLSQLLNAWSQKGFDVHLYTNNVENGGFLSGLNHIKYISGWYTYQKNPWLRLVYYTLSQVTLFFKMYSKVSKNDLIYINTILPFGAALLGKIKGCRIIYHIHETSISPKPLKTFLTKIIQKTATEVIFVSKYVADNYLNLNNKSHLLYNAIENKFLEKASETQKITSFSNVLMVCSLKKYKGVDEFVNLARKMPQYKFRLVLNATKSEISNYFGTDKIPENLELFDSQKNMHPFYSWADIILNLSRPQEWVETFGLTIIEGMAYGLPSIVPEVGGIKEVIENNISGYSINSSKEEELVHLIDKLFQDKSLYYEVSKKAYQRLEIFKEDSFVQKSVEILSNKLSH